MYILRADLDVRGRHGSTAGSRRVEFGKLTKATSDVPERVGEVLVLVIDQSHLCDYTVTPIPYQYVL
jgi:hypothetical protein